MRRVKCFYENGDTITTPINGTDESIREYFVGKYFNFGIEEDKMVKCVGIEFLEVKEEKCGDNNYNK